MNGRERSISSSSSLGSEQVKQAVCFLLDQVICGVTVGPLVVFVWWAEWCFLNNHLFPDRLDLSGYVCFAIGNGGLIALAFTQDIWKKVLLVDNALHWVFGYHFYTAVCVFCNVCHWRGVWSLLDYFTGLGYISAWTTYVIGQCGLLILRGSKNAQAPPMLVISDRAPNFFSYTTRFRSSMSKWSGAETLGVFLVQIRQFSENYVWDVVFTVMIIHHLVVFYWRGLWEVMDYYICPENKTNSALVCYGIAYVLMLLLCVIQPLFNFLYRRFASKKNQYRRFLFAWLLEAITYFFSNIVNVALWRGVWLICDVYVLPDHPDMSHSIILVAGFVGLWVMMCGHSLTIKGCELDGETGGDDDAICICPNQYLRMFRKLLKGEPNQPESGLEDAESQDNEIAFERSKPSLKDKRNGEIVTRF